MTDLEHRLLFLLMAAGPHRACELAEFIGVETGEVNNALAGMSRKQLVKQIHITSSVIKWSIHVLPPTSSDHLVAVAPSGP